MAFTAPTRRSNFSGSAASRDRIRASRASRRFSSRSTTWPRSLAGCVLRARSSARWASTARLSPTVRAIAENVRPSSRSASTRRSTSLWARRGGREGPESPAESRRSSLDRRPSGLDSANPCRLGTLGRGLGLELHLLAFGQLPVTRGSNCTVVHENVGGPVIGRDKPKPFRRIKPFDCTCGHLSPLAAHCARRETMRKPAATRIVREPERSVNDTLFQGHRGTARRARCPRPLTNAQVAVVPATWCASRATPPGARRYPQIFARMSA